MSGRTNELGQPIGEPVPDWTPRARPPRTAMIGRYCRLEPLDPAHHAAQLHAANATDSDGRMWTYLFTGPFASAEEYRAWADRAAAATTHCSMRSSMRKDAPSGVATFMRIEPAMGVIEVGNIAYSPAAPTHAGGHRGDVFDDAARVRRARLPALRVEMRQPERALARGGRCGWASATRACSGRDASTRAATATPPGTRSSTRNGRPSRSGSKRGSTRPTSTPTGRQHRPLVRAPS